MDGGPWTKDERWMVDNVYFKTHVHAHRTEIVSWGSPEYNTKTPENRATHTTNVKMSAELRRAVSKAPPSARNEAP